MFLDRLAGPALFLGDRTRIVPGPLRLRSRKLRQALEGEAGDEPSPPDAFPDDDPYVLTYRPMAFRPSFVIMVINAGLIAAALYGAAVLPHLAWPLVWGAAILAALTVFYAIRTVLRMATSVLYSSRRIRTAVMTPWGPKPLPLEVAWADMTGLTLRRARRIRGPAPLWCEMTIVSKTGQIRVDHRLDRFPRLVERAFWHARQNNLRLDQQTVKIFTDLLMNGGFGRIGEFIAIGLDPDHFAQYARHDESHFDDHPKPDPDDENPDPADEDPETPTAPDKP